MNTLDRIVSVLYLIAGWLDRRFSLRSKRTQSAEKMFEEGMEEKSEAKVTAALDRLKEMDK